MSEFLIPISVFLSLLDIWDRFAYKRDMIARFYVLKEVRI